MELKKNLIRKKDYERYSVRLPFRVFLSRKTNRSRFMFGELEKMHPCFSDECTFDSKIKVGRRGLVSDVVVMNSLKLSEYKTRYFGKKLFLEGNPEKCVFKKKGIKTPLSAALILFAVLVTLIFTGRNQLQTVKNETFVRGEKEAAGEEKISSFESDIQTGKLPGELTDSFLSIIEAESAFLSGLEWTCDGMNESFFASAAYIHPDRLLKTSEIELSAVTYRNNVPYFTAKGKCRVRKSNMNQTEIVWTNGKTGIFDADEEVYAELRNIIGRFGAEFLEENFNPWKIRFILKNATLNETESLISEMAAFILKTGIAIRRLVIRKGGFDDFELEIETAPELEPFMGVNLSILEKRFRLFGLKNKSEKVQSYQIAVEKKTPAKEKSLPVGQSLKKIGEIRHKDGSFVVYFKNQQGKIISEVGN